MARREETLRRPLPGWLNGILVVGALATLVVMEIRRPLRKNRQDKLERDSRNMAMALMSAATISLTEKPLTTRLSQVVQANSWGLLKTLRLPVGLELFISIVLLDYTLYIWHYLTHKVKLLWRFHRSHHCDLDMDATTALRFHAGEMLLSVPWRAGQVLILGISPLALSLWQTITLLAIMFHHSNLRLPERLERWLCRLIVTPRMHGIHHSMVREETDSNWGTIFSWPDYLHGNLRLNVPQAEITLGVPAFQEPASVTLPQIVKMPFNTQGSWRLADGSTPSRRVLPLPATSLAG